MAMPAGGPAQLRPGIGTASRLNTPPVYKWGLILPGGQLPTSVHGRGLATHTLLHLLPPLPTFQINTHDSDTDSSKGSSDVCSYEGNCSSLSTFSLGWRPGGCSDQCCKFSKTDYRDEKVRTAKSSVCHGCQAHPTAVPDRTV
ncbi:hypothetical protein J4Q44_G00283190 [Coregonus suidteri]|uniref:Uncharacterized protein n=1 Tax=Coregonus suidteri TaxID=861788 RepID=A0AAN8L631_9TELE